ncbi:MAG: hypothetical protein Q9162_002200 [Coniocarpon cinnabarinum]
MGNSQPDRLTPVEEPSSSEWPAKFRDIPKPDVLFSALGTTRAQAGGFDNQYKIDHDLNLDLAKAAQAAGAKYYILISSAGTSSSSKMPYSRMKGELDEAVQDIGFEKVVLVKPGLIVGTREDSRPPEAAIRYLATFLGRVSNNKLKDFWAQDADVIGKAAVHAGLKCLNGDQDVPEGKTWILSMADIIRLGRTEWNKGDVA